MISARLRRSASGLRGRLFLLVGLAILSPLVLLTSAGLNRRHDEFAAVEENARNLVRLLAQSTQSRTEGARQFLTALSRASEVRSGDASACKKFVRSLAADQSDTYDDIGVADLSGRVICHALASPTPLQIADRPYFQRAVATGRFSVGEYLIGRVSGVPRLAFSYPMRDTSDHIVGVLFASVDLQRMSKSLKVEHLPSDAVLSVLDRNGTLLAQSDVPERSVGMKATAEQVRRMSSRDEIVVEFKGSDGIPRVFAVAALRDHRREPTLFAVVGLRRDVAMAAADRRLGRDLLILTVLSFGILAAAFVGSEVMIRRPIARLSDATQAIAAGQLETRANDVTGVREVVELGSAFNAMAERLQDRDLLLRRSQRLEAVGQLAGGVAHDFNNVLTVIRGCGELLWDRMQRDTPDYHDMRELLSAAERAAKLTHQLLAFSRRQALQPTPLNLNDTVAQMQAMLTRLIGEDVRLVTALRPDLGIVRADRSQLEQVLMNLVVNARDAMPDGGTLTIETLNTEISANDPEARQELGAIPPSDYVVLVVTDTGCGMDATTAARIFEPFFSTKGAAGTGLGLATVYGIVKQSGGYIYCDSEPGRGTRFRVYLPCTNEPVPLPAASEQRRDVAAANGQERLVVVEDETAVRTFLETVLRRAGYSVRATGLPSEALTWIEQERPDLLLTDIVMPEMNGKDLYTAAVRRWPGLKGVFISGYTNDAAWPRVSTLPPEVAFLRKPFVPASLLETVRSALDGNSPHRTTAFAAAANGAERCDSTQGPAANQSVE